MMRLYLPTSADNGQVINWENLLKSVSIQKVHRFNQITLNYLIRFLYLRNIKG